MVKNPPANAGDAGSIPGSGRSPREGNGYPTPVLLTGKSHGQRSLAGYSPWGRRRLKWDLGTKKQSPIELSVPLIWPQVDLSEMKNTSSTCWVF